MPIQFSLLFFRKSRILLPYRAVNKHVHAGHYSLDSPSKQDFSSQITSQRSTSIDYMYILIFKYNCFLLIFTTFTIFAYQQLLTLIINIVHLIHIRPRFSTKMTFQFLVIPRFPLFPLYSPIGK